ncbi:SUZ domain-containing protein 1 isoform X2 [Meleagris gallopavo]|nr:SUZ domain-containing protein 1 isoform X2 [Meleagris gallopavo]
MLAELLSAFSAQVDAQVVAGSRLGFLLWISPFSRGRAMYVKCYQLLKRAQLPLSVAVLSSSVAHLEIDRRLEKKLKITQKESRKSKSPPKVPIVIQDDSVPSGPPPQIRILKRPATNGVLSNPNSTTRPAFPVKSLAQREAEYAEARKRILGSASPEEEQEKPILDRPTRISQPEDVRQPNNVIRQPLGPDGSQGFKQRR